MSTKHQIVTTRPDPEIFDSMGIFEMADSTRSSLSIRLQFAKFAHGFTIADFEPFIESIGEESVTSIGRLSFPNEWQMTLSSQEVREELIRLGRTRINNRSCWIHPLSSSEIRGFVHWLPNEIPHLKVIEIFRNFGEVLFMETQNYTKFNYRIASDARYFALYLKPGASKEDLPHFITISKRRGLVTVRGRQPACFHCREVGHRKNECKTYREKLGEYCLRPAGTSSRSGIRGRRHKADVANCGPEKENSDISATKLNQKGNEVQTEVNEASEQGDATEIGSETKQEMTRNKNKRKSRRRKKNVKGEEPSTMVEASAVEATKDVQSDKNEDVAADNSETITQKSSTVEHCLKPSIEEGHDSNFDVNNTNVPAVLECENTLVKVEKVDLDPAQEETILSESTIQNPCENSDPLKDDVPLENCLNKNFKNVCNDMVKKMHDSSTDAAPNNCQQVPDETQSDVNNQIGYILNNFILQITDVLSEAGVVNVNEIKNKLLGINGTLLCSNKSETDAKCNLIQHDKNSNVIDPSNVAKASKKKKKKSKKIQE